MKRTLSPVLLATVSAALLFAACSPSQPTPAPTTAPVAVAPTKALVVPNATSTAATTATPAVKAVTPTAQAVSAKPAAFAAADLPADRGALFSGSGACAMCHSNQKDARGNDSSIDTAWRASVHGLAARDPYWQASVRLETVANPALQAVIEDKCATCHMPMARLSAQVAGGTGKVLDDGFANPANKLSSLAMDGVSCTLCHQITSVGLGQSASASGGYDVDSKAPAGQRVLYGPYTETAAQSATHAGVTGFSIQMGDQVARSELCATCHTLYTPFLDSKGAVAGTFPEQMAYVEWQSSEFYNRSSCVDCHMPAANGETLVALGGTPRTGVKNHTFVGGNAFMDQMLIAGGARLGLSASSDQLNTAGSEVLDNMKRGAATVSLDAGELRGPSLDVGIKVATLLGHKFPTGFPSRRAWLHVKVTDSMAKVIFESGAYKLDGSIVGNDNDADPTKFEPHYSTITKPDQVQIYEDIIGDTDGKVSTVLLRGAVYLKDNRLLPSGFDKAKAPKDVAVAGEAKDDANFVGGSDLLHYVIDTTASQGKLTVSVELLYQTIGFRWAENMKKYIGPEISTFTGLYGGVANTPVVVATSERTF